MSLNVFVLNFLFFGQSEESSKGRCIKLKEVMDNDHGQNDLNDDKRAHKCNQCEYVSSWASCLSSHLKTHTGEKPNKCNQCNYASSRAGDLRKHLKTHSGEKSNKCNQCDYKSSEVCNLKRHLKMHSGQK